MPPIQSNENSDPRTERVVAVPARSPETGLEHELAKAAEDISATLEKADKAETRADDLRITASEMLAEAEKKCIAIGRPFKPWIEENIKVWAYTTVMELTAVGRSEDPRQALADMRAKKTMQQRKSRARRSDPRRLGLPDGTFDPTAIAAEFTDEDADLLVEALNDRHLVPGATALIKKANDAFRAAEKADAEMVEGLYAAGFDRQRVEMVLVDNWLRTARKFRAMGLDQETINTVLGTIEFDEGVLEPDAEGIEIVTRVLADMEAADIEATQQTGSPNHLNHSGDRAEDTLLQRLGHRHFDRMRAA